MNYYNDLVNSGAVHSLSGNLAPHGILYPQMGVNSYFNNLNVAGAGVAGVAGGLGG